VFFPCADRYGGLRSESVSGKRRLRAVVEKNVAADADNGTPVAWGWCLNLATDVCAPFTGSAAQVNGKTTIMVASPDEETPNVVIWVILMRQAAVDAQCDDLF